MKKNKIHLKELVIAVSLTAIVGQVYLYPMNAGFRFTAGVVVVSFLLLYYSFIHEILLLTTTGIGVFAFRVFIGYLLSGHSLNALIDIHYPAFFYYLFYGIFLRLFKVRSKIKYPLSFIISMGISDMGANFLELMIRYRFNPFYYKSIFTQVLCISLIRSISTFFIYWLMERHRLIIQTEEHQKRYIQLLGMVSELKAEFFYMQKSQGSLERAMKDGYEIYQILKEDKLDEETVEYLKKRALDLTKDIHEIKKDFVRITSGIRALLPEEEKDGMSIGAMIDIIKKNTYRVLKDIKGQAVLDVEVEEDFIVLDYLSLFTILNNLVSNSIAAIDENGTIKISVETDDKDVIFVVEDDGVGINSKDLPYIFEPGFSTKFTKDGNISTGVGLTHVKALVKELRGTIQVDSKINEGTRFEIRIPIYGNFKKV